MVRQTATTVILEILGGLILLVVVLAALLAFRLSSGPVSLGPFKDDVERALTKSRDGRPVKLGEMQLEWSTTDRRLRVAATDVELLDANHQRAAVASSADIFLDGSALVSGRFEVLRLAMESGWVNVDQISQSEWRVAGEPLPAIPAGQLPQSLGEWLERADQVLPPLLDALASAEQNLSLERISFEDMEIRVRNSDGGSILTLTSAAGLIGREPEGLLLNVAGSGEGEGLPSGLGLTLKATDSNSRLNAQFAVADWPLADLAQRFGVGEGRIVGLPSDVELSVDLSKEDGVEKIVFTVDAGAGTLPRGEEGALDVADLSLISTYTATADVLTVDVRSSDAGPMSGAAVVTLNDALKGEGYRKFEVDADAFKLDFIPGFEAPLTFADVKVKGEIALESRALRELDGAFSLLGLAFDFGGNLMPTPDHKKGEVPFVGKLEFAMPGDVSKETVLALWPVTLGDGGRRFVVEKIEGVMASNVKAELSLARDSFAEGFLRDEDLSLTFDVRDGNVNILHDLPNVTNASGSGKLTGNGIRLVLTEGEFGDWTLSEGAVDFPAFNPVGEDIRVFAKGVGPAQSMMQILSDSRLDEPIAPERVSGMGEVTFEMFRPARSQVPMEKIRYMAIGHISDGGLKSAALGRDITNGRVDVNMDQFGLTVSGHGDLGASPVQFTWRDAFNDGNQPANLSATAVVTPDVLNEFGLLGRAYLSGEVPLELQAKVARTGVLTADTSLDLTLARVDISEIGWIKPSGEDARASIQYKNDGDGFTSDVLFKSGDALLEGAFKLNDSSRLERVSLKRAYLADKVDVSGALTRTDQGAIIIALNGPYLDLSGAMPGVGAVSQNEQRDGTPMTVTANVEAVTLRPGLVMRNADIQLESTNAGVRTFSATGNADDGSDLSAKFDRNDTGDANIHIESGDAGFFTLAFLEADFIEGGKLVLDGTLYSDNRPAKFDLTVTDGRLRDAPFLTQILSLGSLRGLADTLGGEGVLFSRIDVPFTVVDGRYVVKGAKAQGPALGLTANGHFGGENDAIEFDGVLVPSFGMNSALGGIPIIGDLVVGRDGEGIFSLTYAIRGTLEEANVSVNPLSALAPGVIRRIFENPTETTIPEAETRPEDVPIPSELPPIPEETF